MKNLFVGIDISKDVFDAVVLDYKGNIVAKDLQYPNDQQGMKAFHKQLQSLKSPTWICMENTGCYGFYICMFLQELKYNFSVVNPLEIKKSIGITRGKNDAIDAYRIAKYAQMNQYQLKPYKLPAETLRKLKEYVGSRELAVKQKVQLMNRVKALKISNKITDIASLIELEEASIELQKKKIATLERMILDTMTQDAQILETYNKITSIKGVGLITAILIILETECFQKTTRARSFSCHCGVAPFKHESGSSVRGRARTSRYRKKELKTVLFQAAGSAIQHEPQLRAYYKRKVAEGKSKMSVLNAVSNKLLLRIFAVALREEPWVELAA